MDAAVVKALVSGNASSVGDLVRQRIAASYSIYRTIKELEWLGVIRFEKGSIAFLDSPASSAFKRLFFEGFDIGILSKKNVEFLLALLEPKTVAEAAAETGKSLAQTARVIRSLMPFLGKESGRYFVSKSNKPLFGFLLMVKEKNSLHYYWRKGKEGLLRLPKGFGFDGVLTGFSRFSEFEVAIDASHNFVYTPKSDLAIEEILSHAIKFSQNANDLALCIIFYLKNKPKIDATKMEKNCEHLAAMPVWLDIVSFLEGQPVKNQKLFLPAKEFLEKAKLYDTKITPRFDKSAIESIFSGAEKNIAGKVNVFSIGGNALIEYGLKNSTKDIDIVVISQVDAENLARALKSNGFVAIAEKEQQYEKLGASTMLEKKGFPRIDLFVKKICNALDFSNGMQKRSKKTKEGKIELCLASLEDIFLLKSISSRDSDLIDCENILQKANLDWNAIYTEIHAQQGNLNNSELTILDHFETLEKRLGIKIPITKKILRLCIEKAILFMAKKPVSVKELMQKIDFPETTVRNKITQLVKTKKLKKISSKPFTIIAKSGSN